MKVSLVTCRCMRRKAVRLKNQLEQEGGLEDVEVVLNGRWRTFSIKVDGETRMEAKGWGRHVPDFSAAMKFIMGE